MTAAPAGTAGTIVAGHKPVPKAAALLAVLGVVYGDIGTSPLYAFKTSLQLFHGLPVTETEIMGILSLIFWSLEPGWSFLDCIYFVFISLTTIGEPISLAKQTFKYIQYSTYMKSTV